MAANGDALKQIVGGEIKDEEHDTKELFLQKYFLREWSTLKSIFDDFVASSQLSFSSAHKIRSIVDKYQEQGQLLEPYLETMVSPLMSAVRCKSSHLSLDDQALLEVKPLCIALYSLVTACGYKSVIRFFPHHVSDLELAVSLLEKCHEDVSTCSSLRQESTGEMEVKCIALLWLSILVLVPFDISTVDTSLPDNDCSGKVAPMVNKIMSFATDYLSSAGPMRGISGLLLSKLLNRPDMTLSFTRFVDWSRQELAAKEVDVTSYFRLLGAVEALVAIFKVGRRNQLANTIPIIWNEVSALLKSSTASRSPLLRKYVIKLVQRIGLVSLPYRTAAWHYVRRTVSLAGSLPDPPERGDLYGLNQSSIECPVKSCAPDETDMDVPEIVEEIIEMMLCGLRDTDTVVRWSAAKGIGRITLRLTSSLSEEILTSLLDFFDTGEGVDSWHGACLALAELARRGLLLPNNLPKVVPFIVKALHYDVRRGPHSVGSHVRDAAAYVCWAFGRAYCHTDMQNILEQFAPHLLIVSCYDREVNCRRAAAAAFQENIGRQGSYPHGIDIVNAADYFSLSSRLNSYLKVAVSIAQYDSYLCPFVDDLLHNKINHWDKSLRELAAQALAALAKYDRDYFSNFVLEKLIPLTLSSDLCTRHGAVLAAGEVVFALCQCGHVLPNEKQKVIAGVVPAIDKARLYRGKGGEIMRAAVSRFIECISVAHVALPQRIKQTFIETLDENLKHPNSQIQDAAVKGLKYFVRGYLATDSNMPVVGMAHKYLKQLTDPNVAVRRGSALALGSLPYECFSNCWNDVIVKLCSSCLVEENPEDRDAESRTNAVKGLVSVCETIVRSSESTSCVMPDISPFLVIKNIVLKSLLRALDDYCVDNRGDVGSWVREAAIEGLEKCTYLLCTGDYIKASSCAQSLATLSNDSGDKYLFFDANIATSVISGITKLAVEKMDRLREVSANALQRILYNRTVLVPFIPERETLEKIIPDQVDLSWADPMFSYPRFVQLLQFPSYSKVVLSGLVTAVGGLQDSLRKASLLALFDYLKSDDNISLSSSRCFHLTTDIIWVLHEYRKCDRIVVPTLKMIEILFSRNLLLTMEVISTDFYSDLFECLKVELKGTKDFSKLYSGIAMLGFMVSITADIRYRSFTYLLKFLSHRYPKIRKAAAEQIYLVLLQTGDILLQDKIGTAFEIVSETCWEGDLELAKHQQLALLELAGVEAAMTVSAETKTPSEKIANEIDENAHYSSLVGSTGF